MMICEVTAFVIVILHGEIRELGVFNVKFTTAIEDVVAVQ